MKSTKKMRPTPAMIAEAIVLEMTSSLVNTLKSSDAVRSVWFVWKLHNFNTLTMAPSLYELTCWVEPWVGESVKWMRKRVLEREIE